MTASPTTPAAKLAAWFMRRTATVGVRRVAPACGAVASDVGSVREENQDRVALVRGCDNSGGTFVLAALADGIGGLKRGAECAALTLGTFIESIVSDAQSSPEPRDWLDRGAQRANRAVHARYSGEGGSTLVAVLLTKAQPPLWLSIGDSRVYQAEDAKLRQLSRDDTLEGQLGKPIDGGRSELLQFVGIGEALEPHIKEVPRDETGTILLTTDGIHFIDADNLGKVVHHAPDLGLCVRRLTELAKMLGGTDNASVAALALDPLALAPDDLLDVAYDVWDPFGELQVMVDRRSRRYGSTTTQPSPRPELAKQDVPLATAPASSPALGAAAAPEAAGPKHHQSASKAKNQSKKTKGSRKKKEPTGEAEQHSEPGVPQLLIEFPNKTP